MKTELITINILLYTGGIKNGRFNISRKNCRSNRRWFFSKSIVRSASWKELKLLIKDERMDADGAS